MSLALTRWFRKNNRKILAVMVIVLMVGFIGGSALRFSCRATGFDPGQVVATFGTKGEMTQTDIMTAERELDILRRLGVPNVLRTQDISGILLGELLFTERDASPRVMGALRNVIQQRQLRVTNQQLLDISNRQQRQEIYWILLKKEIEQAGIAINKETSLAMLSRIIPQMYEGLTYSAMVNQIIKAGIPEETVLDTFGRVIAVLEYARLTVSCEDFTLAQISQLASRQNESIDAEFVRMPSSLFADDQPEPAPEKINEHFEKYKNYYHTQVTEENPYGFGYKFDDMIKLEYIAVKREDVEKIIKEPTLADKEKYYQDYRYKFTKEVPIDPNDPNSPTTGKLLKFGEVAVPITNMIRAERIAEKIDTILSKVKYLAEESYGDIDRAELKGDKLKELAQDFEKIAEEISETFSIKIYSGQTGLLSVSDIQQDKYIGRMYYQPPASEQISYPLVQYVFAAEELGNEDIVVTSIDKPKLYETIGPVADSFGRFAAVIRITDVQSAKVPESIDESIDKTTMQLGEDNDGEDNVFFVKEKVVEELKLLAGQNEAGKKAQEFITVAEDTGWDKAIEKYNELYSPEPNEPNNFELITLTGLNRFGAETVEVLKAQSKGFAGADLSLYQMRARMMIVDKLFSLIQPKSDTPQKLPVVVEMIPNMSYYCIKSLKMNRLDRDEYYKSKAISVYQHGFKEFQNLAFDHFKPENIVTRMNFQVIREKKAPAEPNKIPLMS